MLNGFISAFSITASILLLASFGYASQNEAAPRKPTEATPRPAVEQVTWSQAVDALENGQVAEVMQMHSLEVTLTLKDGRTWITSEPAIDEVFRVIRRCLRCGGIRRSTE